MPWRATEDGFERVTDVEQPHIRELPCVLPGIFAPARAQAAGFDGVELHYAHAYTMAPFLSAGTRARTGTMAHGSAASARRSTEVAQFPLVRNERWYGDHLVRLGDALHTAHFSTGSGTKLALEDAISLARVFDAEPDPPAALRLFERSRRPRVEELQYTAVESLQWFENMADCMQLAPLPSAMDAMIRSKEIGVGKVRQRDPGFVAAFGRWSTETAGR